MNKKKLNATRHPIMSPNVSVLIPSSSLIFIPSFLSHFVQPDGILLKLAQIASKTLSGLIYPLKVWPLILTCGYICDPSSYQSLVLFARTSLSSFAYDSMPLEEKVFLTHSSIRSYLISSAFTPS